MHPPPGRPWVIAHRGASQAFRENTLEAFRGAAALGADAVEFDVRRTADGVPVIHHDAAVPGLGPIVSATAEQLRGRAPWVPTLDEALSACPGMWVAVEVKNSPADPDWDPSNALVEVVVAALETAACIAAALLSSFNTSTLARARALAPALPTGWFVGRQMPLAMAVREEAAAGHRALLPHAPALAGPSGPVAVGAAHEAGVLLVCWTLDDPIELRRLADAGIDGVITNRPDAALSALGEHGHHHRG